MVFPDNDYITVQISSSSSVQFAFPTKKPKKFWLDTDANNVSFRMKFNDDSVGMLIHMSNYFTKEFTIPSTVNSIELTTTLDSQFTLTILVEEWNN